MTTAEAPTILPVTVETVYLRVYTFTDHPERGYSFPCNPRGFVFGGQLGPLGNINLERIRRGEIPGLVDNGAFRFEQTTIPSSIVTCEECGCSITLHTRLRSTCWECRADYTIPLTNFGGRDTWGRPIDQTLGERLDLAETVGRTDEAQLPMDGVEQAPTATIDDLNAGLLALLSEMAQEDNQ